LRSDLSAKATTTKIEKRRGRPAIPGAPANHTLTTASAKDKRGFHDARKDRNRLGFVEQLLRNRLLSDVIISVKTFAASPAWRVAS